MTTFQSFWDSFNSTIDKNSGIPNTDKSKHLKALEGPAARLVQGLPLTDASFAHARKLSEDRYGKTQVIISAHMDNLIKINPCANDKPNQLRYMFDQIRVQIRGLESLGVKTESYGQLLIPIIMLKLPSEIRLQVSRVTEKKVWEIQEMLDLIQKEIEGRETTEQVKVTMEQRIKQGSGGFSHQGNYYGKPFNPQLNNNSSTGAALFTRSRGNDSRANSTIVCVYCGQTHFSASSENIRDISQRKNILLRDRRCFAYASKCLIIFLLDNMKDR